jgi:dTDP-4-dehydrorhamnose reductase
MASSDVPLLIFGREGQLAQSFKKLEPSARFVSRSECDFLKPESLISVLEQIQPEVVINCAAYTQVDAAETDVETVRQVNAKTPQVIANWCADNAASLIHYSTDYVYNGEGATPWLEISNTAPLNEYGRSKLAGEQAIASSGCHHFILRTSWLFSPFGNNFVKTMLRLGAERENLRVVADQFGSPTSTLDLARTTLQMLAHKDFKSLSGVFHVTNSGYASWHEFAQAIFAEARRQHFPLKIQQVEAIPTSAYPTPASRPLNSRLSPMKLKQLFGLELQPWPSALNETLKYLL